MMCFPCGVCGQPRSVETLAAWVFDTPFCTPVCVTQAHPRERPSPEAALGTAAASLAASARLVDDAIASVVQTSNDVSAGQIAGVTARLLFGSLLGSVAAGMADDFAERAAGAHQARMWSLEQALLKLARDLMALHGLGYPIAAHMTPLVSQYASLVDVGTPRGREQFVQLRAYLARLAQFVATWRNDV